MDSERAAMIDRWRPQLVLTAEEQAKCDAGLLEDEPEPPESEMTTVGEVLSGNEANVPENGVG